MNLKIKQSEMRNNLMNRVSSLEEEDLIKLVSIINDMNEIISKLL